MQVVKFARSLALITAFAVLAGCGGEDISGDLLEPVPRGGGGSGLPVGGIDLSAYAYVLAAADREGNLSFYGDDGIELIEPIMDPDNPDFPLTLSLANDFGEPYGLGDVVHAHDSSGAHWLFVVLSSGVLDEFGEPVGGGLAMIDMHTLQLSQIIPLRSDFTGLPSNPGRAVLSPDGLSLWVTNTGPKDDPSTSDVNEAEGDDTLFVVMIDDPLAPVEVPVGDRPRGGAFAPYVDGGPDINNWYVNLNGPSHTINVYDYTDPFNPYQVGDLLDLNGHLEPKADGSLPKRNFASSVAYSPFSGKFYIGITQGVDTAVATVDAKLENGDVPFLDVDLFKSEKAGGLIPAAGFIKTTADGRFVFTTGWLQGKTPEEAAGYLSVIDALSDEVVDVVPLGNLASSSFNIVEDGLSIRVYIAGADRTQGADELEGILNNQVAMVMFDLESGVHMQNELGEDVTYIEVSKGDNTREMAMTTYGEHLFVPGGNRRECGEILDGIAEPGSNGCSRIAVVDTGMNMVLTEFDTPGAAPTWLAVFETALDAGAPGEEELEPEESGGHGTHH